MANKLYIDDGLGQIRLEEINPREYRLLDPFVYVRVPTASNFFCPITVPAGFVTDGTSSPFRILIETWGGHYSSAALVHDWLYDCLNRGQPDQNAPTRKDADDILFEIMKRCGVHFLVRWGMYIAVRGLGGPGMRGLGVATVQPDKMVLA